MTITFLEPRAEPGLPTDPYAVARFDRTVPVTIGLLANGFPDSVAFLDEVEKALLAVAPAGTTTKRYAKPNASVVVSDKVLGSIAAECSAVIAAYGH